MRQRRKGKDVGKLTDIGFELVNEATKIGGKIEWRRRRTQRKTISKINNKIQQQEHDKK